MEHNDDTDWIKRVMEVQGTKPRRRLILCDGIKEDMKRFGLSW